MRNPYSTLKKENAFFDAYARAVNIFPSSNAITIADIENGPMQDALALRSDWLSVGKSLRRSLEKIKSEDSNKR